MVTVLQVVRVHKSDPLHEAHIVDLHSISKDALILATFLQEEHIDVRRVELRLFLALKRAHLRQEITRAQFEVVVEDQDRTVIL